VRYFEDTGDEATLEQAFTFAHAVALDPAYRGHFRIILDEAWSTEQIELAEYVAAPVAAVARKIPFIWVVNEGRLARAVVTRELAYAARDRLRAWHILQELAGTDNEYARRSAELARIDTRTRAEIRGKVLEVGHAAEVDKARTQAVRAAMERLARRLVGVETIPAPTRTNNEPKELPVPVEAVEAVVTPAEERPEEDAHVAIEDPYIDTDLCTSCADCININPELFKYDANKQAFIANADLGTYAQLVKAAEKCPARCIHPGLPVASDKTANERLVTRAAKFN
jgi:ferredoxin